MQRNARPKWVYITETPAGTLVTHNRWDAEIHRLRYGGTVRRLPARPAKTRGGKSASKFSIDKCSE